MPRKKLRLYVWPDALADYTPGIMFALATSEEDAREQIRRESGGSPAVDCDLRASPEVYDKPVAYVVWGGG